MEIRNVEFSPFPTLHSVRSDRLQFTRVERNALFRARDIAYKAQEKLREHLGQLDMEETDLYRSLTQIWAGIEDLLETNDVEQGVRIN